MSPFAYIQCALAINKTGPTAVVKYLQVAKSQERVSILGDFSKPRKSGCDPAELDLDMNQARTGHWNAVLVFRQTF